MKTFEIEFPLGRILADATRLSGTSRAMEQTVLSLFIVLPVGSLDFSLYADQDGCGISMVSFGDHLFL